MNIKFYQLTSVGDRETNQDYMAHRIEKQFALFVVADGLGGHVGGEKASRFFCQGLLKCADAYTKRIGNSPVNVFTAWLEAAVMEMQKLFTKDLAVYQAHTTCAVLYMDNKHVLTGHCGDSRIYRMNPNEIIWRTRDHSIPQQLLNDGMISDQEMNSHPAQNKLTRSINAMSPSEIEINIYPAYKPGETFILCTDGFWANIKTLEFLQLAQKTSDKAELGRLAQFSLLRGNGNSDNITVQWIRCL